MPCQLLQPAVVRDTVAREMMYVLRTRFSLGPTAAKICRLYVAIACFVL